MLTHTYVCMCIVCWFTGVKLEVFVGSDVDFGYTVLCVTICSSVEEKNTVWERFSTVGVSGFDITRGGGEGGGTRLMSITCTTVLSQLMVT